MSSDKNKQTLKESRALNIDGLERDDAKFVSNVTGIGWSKNSAKRWSKVINQVGVVINDEIHQGKNHTSVTLPSGSRVIVDDIRGRINPQYRVRDTNGKIWFVSADNLDFEFDETIIAENRANTDMAGTYMYRGGVRVDGTDEENDVAPKRYAMPSTTEEEIRLLKEKKKNG
jgi:hypothetical protein